MRPRRNIIKDEIKKYNKSFESTIRVLDIKKRAIKIQKTTKKTIPPVLGTGFEWIFLSLGKSKILNLLPNFIAKGEISVESRKLTQKLKIYIIDYKNNNS